MAEKTKIKVDHEFASLCPPLSPDERAILETSLKAEGCRDPLVLWKGHNVLIDGHNRHELCTTHKIDFKTVEVDLKDRDAVKQWIVANQLSRRNLTPEAASYLRGRRYNAEKLEPGRPEKGDQSDPIKTSDRLAQEFKVGAATIKRDGKFAEAVDLIATNCGDDARVLILARDTGLSRGGVLKLAKLAKEKQQEAVAAFKQTGKWPRKPQTKKKPQAIVKTLARSIAGRGVEDALAVIKETAKLLKLSVKDLLEQAAKAK